MELYLELTPLEWGGGGCSRGVGAGRGVAVSVMEGRLGAGGWFVLAIMVRGRVFEYKERVYFVLSVIVSVDSWWFVGEYFSLQVVLTLLYDLNLFTCFLHLSVALGLGVAASRF